MPNNMLGYSYIIYLLLFPDVTGVYIDLETGNQIQHVFFQSSSGKKRSRSRAHRGRQNKGGQLTAHRNKHKRLDKIILI